MLFMCSLIEYLYLPISPPAIINGMINHKLCLQRFNAIFHQRVITSVRNLGYFLMHIFLVVLFVVAGCSIVVASPKLRDLPPYSLHLNRFHQPSAPYLLRDPNISVIDELGEKYRKVLKDTKAADSPLVNDVPWFANDTNMDDYLLWNGEQDMDHYVHDLLTAATFSDGALRTTLTGHFNNEAYHTSAISLNLISNTLVKYLLGDSYSIRPTNHPLPRDERLTLDDMFSPNVADALVLAFCIMFGFVFLTSSFTTVIVEQRKSGLKRSQHMCGVTAGLFWCSTFVWDYIVLLICGLITTCILLAFQLDAYTSCEGFGYVPHHRASRLASISRLHSSTVIPYLPFQFIFCITRLMKHEVLNAFSICEKNPMTNSMPEYFLSEKFLLYILFQRPFIWFFLIRLGSYTIELCIDIPV